MIPIPLTILFFPSRSLIPEAFTAPKIIMKMTLAAIATTSKLNNKTKIILRIPEMIIALIGTLVFGLILANAFGIIRS